MKFLDKVFEHIRKKRQLNTFVILSRYLIGFAFIPSGLTKVLNERFTRISTDTPIGFFFEGLYQSGAFWQFIGWSQLIAAFLLMTQRFASIGALIYLPLITSIWIITCSLHFTGTWIITSLMLVACLGLLAWDYQKWKPLLYPDNFTYDNTKSHYPTYSNTWIGLGMVLFAWNLVGAWCTHLTKVPGLYLLAGLGVNVLLVLSTLIIEERSYRKTTKPQ
ncbi:MAG: hypothetical protein ACKOWL_02235 [Sphingobacteriaceae bacterium]